MHKPYYLLLAFFIATVSYGQVMIQFSPAISGQTLQGLANVRVISSHPSDLKGILSVIVRSANKIVVTVKTNLFYLHPGSNDLSRSIFSGARYIFGNNEFGIMLSQSGRLQEGDYEYCFELDISESKATQIPAFYEQCFNYNVQPSTPLILINPVDGDEQCNKRPDFLWQLPQPILPGSGSRLILAEIKDRQDIAEAIAYNLPVINQAAIQGNMLRFPSSAPELIEGKKYAWQVTVYNGRTILKKSEIWIYSISCDQPLPKTISDDSYRELRETDDGNFYYAKKYLRFSFNNPYNGGELSYSITNIQSPSVSVNKLPVVKIIPGLNKYALDISENESFKNGQEYLLKVNLATGRTLSLRFIYKNE